MKESIKKEGNLYDKILKENADELFLDLIEKELGSKIRKKKFIKHKLQVTLERETDFLYDIELHDQRNFILHIEFQTTMDTDMVFRIAEYHGILLKKYKKTIAHFVIYIGSKKGNIKTELNADQIFKSFYFINLRNIEVNDFLSTQIPEKLVLAILADYPKERTEEILRLIVKKLQQKSKNLPLFNKFVKQLLVLSRLRKLEDITTKIVKEMPVFIDIKKDILYLEGKSEGKIEGIKEGKIEGIKEGAIETTEKFVNNAHEYGYSIKEISNILGIQQQKVRAIIKKNIK